jgi:hypothetical protein
VSSSTHKLANACACQPAARTEPSSIIPSANALPQSATLYFPFVTGSMVSLQQELQVSIIQTLLVKMQLIKVYSKKTAHLVALDSLSHLTSTVKLSEYFKATLISPILKIAHVELMFRQLVVIPLIASLISTYAHSSQAVSTLLVANNG